MLPLSDIPVAVIAWTVGAFASISIGLRAFISYRATRNEVSKYYVGFGLILGAGELMYQIPAWFTQDTTVLRLWALAGDLCFYASMIILARVIWFYSLKRFIRFGVLAAILVAWTAVTWGIDFFTSTVTISPGNIEWNDVPIAGTMRAIFYIAILLPNGWYVLSRALSEKGSRARLRAYTLGIGFLAVGGALSYEYIANRGTIPDTIDLMFLIIFTCLFFAIWLPVIFRFPGAKQSKQL
jgi:hypothetical protein